MWTAFGIMIGNVMDLAFFHVPDKHNIKGLNWRLMLGSVSRFHLCQRLNAEINSNDQAGIPALIIMSQVFFCPESPRWLMSKGRYDKAYESLLRLRSSDIQAARDLFCK